MVFLIPSSLHREECEEGEETPLHYDDDDDGDVEEKETKPFSQSLIRSSVVKDLLNEMFITHSTSVLCKFTQYSIGRVLSPLHVTNEQF